MGARCSAHPSETAARPKTPTRTARVHIRPALKCGASDDCMKTLLRTDSHHREVMRQPLRAIEEMAWKKNWLPTSSSGSFRALQKHGWRSTRPNCKHGAIKRTAVF